MFPLSKIPLTPNFDFRVFDDTKTCWHGSAIYEDCNNGFWQRNLKIRYKGGNCKWWHFYPHETYADLKSKFQEIMKNSNSKNLLNIAMHAAKKIQLKTFGKDLL